MPKKIEKKSMTLNKIAKQFSDETEAWKFLESVRWENGVICPHCGSINESKFLSPHNGKRTTRTGKVTYRRVWQCGACNRQFSVLAGTIFGDSRIPLSKWLLAIHEMWADKNGVSSLELARKLDITQKSAWFMAHRIRHAIAYQSSDKLQGIIEADETYIGGKAENMHKSKREKKITGRGPVDKTPVLSIIERGGEVRSQVMRQVTGDAVQTALRENVKASAALMTDTLPVYQKAGKEFASHETVDHGADEWVRGNAHINSAEGFFGQLKPSIRGTYRHISIKHLSRYLNEFDYRYTTRKSADGDRSVRAIKQVFGKRLTYKTLINKGGQ